MWNTAASEKYRWLVISLVLGMACFLAVPSMGGPYLDSGHGNPSDGVNRSAIDGKYAEFATGNCAHCHETHASLQGIEPSPAGGPDSHTLFAKSFNPNRTLNPYLETDNFCFYCHSDTSAPQVRNRDYSSTFGGGGAEEGPQSIMAAFNQISYHNLNDIRNFLLNSLTYSAWFAKRDNPCSACHNSHRAKRNWDGGQPDFPLRSTISKPGNSVTLWGETEVMSSYLGYEAPQVFGDTREPAGVGEQDGGNTPDYFGFCTACHSPDNIIWSSTLNRNLKKINWGMTGVQKDKHGVLQRDGASYFREPYLAAAGMKNNFILSCLDCHESHGSSNIMMLRRRINGENLEGSVASTDAMGYVCKRCHQDDLAAAAGTGEANRWEYLHHGRPNAPYAKMGCMGCHGLGGDNSPIPCGNCHGHGMDDAWAGAKATGLKTF